MSDEPTTSKDATPGGACADTWPEKPGEGPPGFLGMQGGAVTLVAGLAAGLFALGLVVGLCVRPDTPPAAQVKQPPASIGTRPPKIAPSRPARPGPTSEFKALLEFAHEQIREGHLLAAKAACEKIIASADDEAAKKARLALETVEGRMSAQERHLDDARYRPFAAGLDGSSSRINGCKFHGSMYNATAEEARDMFARYLRERNMTHELRINAKYPLYFWGSNHANLQCGLAHGTIDVIRGMIREGGNIAGLAKIIESRRGMGASFDRSLDFMREIAGRNQLTPEQKGELYWRVKRCVLTLAPNNPDDTPAAAKRLLAALGSALSRLEPFKDSFDPDGAREIEGGEVF